MSTPNDYVKKYEPLWGSWSVEKFVGEGSFGKVYKISREDWGQKYESALKLIRIPQSENDIKETKTIGLDDESVEAYFEDYVNNIVKEIELMYKVKGNSNIVNYEDHMIVSNEDAIGWDILIRMEFLETLQDYSERVNLLSNPKEIVRLGMEICSGLETCAKENIIHRDIKDGNIFVNKNGMFKLGDFGIAKELTKSGRAASMRGTPLYMAPEVYRGDQYDMTVDIYSLGIVMYKLLNRGRIPFMPPPEVKKIKYQHTEEAIEMRMKGEEMLLPVDAQNQLGQVIVKACSFSPEERYSNPTEFKMALKEALEFVDEAIGDSSQEVVLGPQDEQEKLEVELGLELESKTDQDTAMLQEAEGDLGGTSSFFDKDAVGDLGATTSLITNDGVEEEVIEEVVEEPEPPAEEIAVEAEPEPEPEKKNGSMKIIIGGLALAAVAAAAFFMMPSKTIYSEVYTWSEFNSVNIESVEAFLEIDPDAIVHTDLTDEDFASVDESLEGMPVELVGKNEQGNIKVYGFKRFVAFTEDSPSHLKAFKGPDSLQEASAEAEIQIVSEADFNTSVLNHNGLALEEAVLSSGGNIKIYQYTPLSVVYTYSDINTLTTVGSLEEIMELDPDAIVKENLNIESYEAMSLTEEEIPELVEVGHEPLFVDGSNIKLFQLTKTEAPVVEAVEVEPVVVKKTETKKTTTTTKKTTTNTSTVDTTLDLN